MSKKKAKDPWSFSHNHYGYTILFNGQPVGGGGVKKRGRRSVKNLEAYRRIAAQNLDTCREAHARFPFDLAKGQTFWEWLEDSYKATDKAATLCYDTAGKVSGSIRGRSRCNLSGCRGVRLHVRWPDGKLTKPCLEACFMREDGQYQITDRG